MISLFHCRKMMAFALAASLGLSILASSLEAEAPRLHELLGPTASPMNTKPPVILVHGIKDSGRKMRHLAAYLEQEGWQSHACSLEPCNGSVGIDILAGQLNEYIEATVPKEERFHLVGFSMGGLISRYYLQRLGGLSRVHRFVTIATPHRGSLWAHLLSSPACRQMRPQSPFLRDLDTDADQLSQVHFTSLWSPLDAIIIPASHSIHPAARNRRLFSLAHPLMVYQRHCLKAVAEALMEEVPPKKIE